MAVVFISPKERQKVFFLGITIGFAVIVIFVSLLVFLAGPKKVEPVLVFNKPKVNIDMHIFDTDQFKNLYPFSDILVQYEYIALTEDGKEITGFISAASEEDARKLLEEVLGEAGMTISDIKEAEIGRDNPFVPYY